MRIALIGDVGGHAEELYAALVGLGADPVTLALPPDLHVVQVGDLVHRGPASSEVLDVVEGMVARGERWTQLIGNHEALYLDEPIFVWPERLSDADAERLRRWWACGWARVGTALAVHGGPLRRGAAARRDEGETEEVLVTHAGLTAGLWRQLGSPSSARDAAEGLEGLRSHPSALWRAGAMLGGEPDWRAGPLWAEAGRELAASWGREDVVPFGQVHGHSSAYWWRERLWSVPTRWQRVLDVERRHVHLEVGGRPLVGIDPQFGARAHRWEPLILEGDVLA